MKNEIPMPSPDEKRRAIERIMETAFPKRLSGLGSIVRIFRTLGLKGIFFDTGECVALSLMTGAIFFAVAAVGHCAAPYTAVFATSPVFYLVLLFSLSMRERYNGMEQLKYTCRFTPMHICVAQNILFSGASLALCALTSLGMRLFQSEYEVLSFAELWCVGAISQLLCSLVTLLCIDRRLRRLPDIAALGYALLCIALFGFDSRAEISAELFFKSLPPIVLPLITAALAAVYVFSIFNAVKHTAMKPKGEVI